MEEKIALKIYLAFLRKPKIDFHSCSSKLTFKHEPWNIKALENFGDSILNSNSELPVIT